MNLFRKLAWAAVVATSGLPASTVTTAEAAPRPAVSRESLGWPWDCPPEDDLEDEFEGEGWSFWGD